MTTVYMRYTDKTGKSYVMSHEVWDLQRFISARTDEMRKHDGKAEVIDSATYKSEKKHA